MKILRWTMIALMGSAVLHACTVKSAGPDDDDVTSTGSGQATTGSGGATGATTGTGTATTGAMSSTGSSMNDCSTSNISGDTACEPCIQQSCCSQITTYSGAPDEVAAQALQQCAFDAGCSGCQYILCESMKAIFVFKNLADCINTNCCTAFTACDAETNCAACMTGGGTDCPNDALYTAYTECVTTNSCTP